MINWAEQGGEMPSGVSLMIKDLERTEDYYDDLELFRMYEEEFFIVEKSIVQVNHINLSNNFVVNFVEPEYPHSIQDQIALHTYRLSNNLTTRPKLLHEINTDLSLEEAEQIVNTNAEINADIEQR